MLSAKTAGVCVSKSLDYLTRESTGDKVRVMPNLQKIFWVVLGLTVLIWIGVGIYYLKSSPSKVQLTPPPQVTTFSSPQPTEPPFLESLEGTHFVVGEFQSWEEIENSQDRYILITNPTTKRNYSKIKVVWESNPYQSYDFWEGMTGFSVEKTEEESDDLGYLRDFTAEEIDKLIKKGDLIKVVFEKESIIEKIEQGSEDLKATDLEGKTDDHLALSLIIKREEGKAAVEQELGREIKE